MRRSGRWFLTAVILVAVLMAGTVFWLSSRYMQHPVAAPMPRPSAVVTPSDIPSSAAITTMPTPSTMRPSGPKPISIKGSEPTGLYFPSLKAYVPMDDKSCPQDPDGLFDPDQTKMMDACYVNNKKYVYVLPGTSTADVSVIYGHTWRQGNASFNILFDWKRQRFTLNKGDEVWVRTKASGKRWLVYKASEFYTPAKYGDKSLHTDTKIWGTAPMPNTLITAGCLQPRDLDIHASRNIVIKWTFAGVRK